MLTARARGAKRVDAQIRRIQLDRLDFFQLRKDGHCAGRGMNASLRLGGGHALHAVRSGFEFEQRIRPAADDAADDFLVAAMLARTFAQNLDAPTLGFGITRVPPAQSAPNDPRPVPPRPSPPFPDA